jgi:hypothetical protein
MLTGPRHLDIAERIVKTEGLTFALAVSNGGQADLRVAREMLKAAIVRALARERLYDARQTRVSTQAALGRAGIRPGVHRLARRRDGANGAGRPARVCGARREERGMSYIIEQKTGPRSP